MVRYGISVEQYTQNRILVLKHFIILAESNQLFKCSSVARWSRGSLIATGCGPTGGSISYQDFCSGKLPPR